MLLVSVEVDEAIVGSGAEVVFEAWGWTAFDSSLSEIEFRTPIRSEFLDEGSYDVLINKLRKIFYFIYTPICTSKVC